MPVVKIKVLNEPSNDPEAPKEKRLGGQAGTIVRTLISMGATDQYIERSQLVEELEASGELNTRQIVERVVGYYQPRLAKSGWIEFITEDGDDDDGEKKPKKSKKTAAKPTPAKVEIDEGDVDGEPKQDDAEPDHDDAEMEHADGEQRQKNRLTLKKNTKAKREQGMEAGAA